MTCTQCEKLKEALLDMCIQFSSSSDDRLQHSFMSAEEDAFYLLGLKNGMTFEEAQRKVLAAGPSPLTSVIEWVPVSERLPKPHAKYAVMRDGLLFTATPCYGLHEPLWVVRTMPSDWPNEAEPVAIKDTDLWAELPQPPASEEEKG